MTNPYPPYQQPRKLERSRSNKVLGGVCGGVANYVNMDPTLVRVLTVVISLFTGVPIIAYLVALFVVPEERADSDVAGYPPVNGPQWTYGGYPQSSARGGSGTPGDPIWGQEGAPWEQHQAPVTPQDHQPTHQQTSTWETSSADQGTTPDSSDGKRL